MTNVTGGPQEGELQTEVSVLRGPELPSKPTWHRPVITRIDIALTMALKGSYTDGFSGSVD